MTQAARPFGRWAVPRHPPRVHGGVDAAGPLPHDFSSNANAAGPLPSVAAAVRRADRTRYPDPQYHALRQVLAGWHRVAFERVLPVASGSAFIQQFTRAAAAWAGVRRVVLPVPGYGDYAAAARAEGLAACAYRRLAQAPPPQPGELWWITEPASPEGTTAAPLLGGWLHAAHAAGAIVVLDLAYEPLRLDRAAPGPVRTDATAWQLWSPNKACGLTGVRGAYAIAPPGAEDTAQALLRDAASWPLGADGVALLQAFGTPKAQAELAASREVLRAWRAGLASLLRGRGWAAGDADSVVPFFCARPAVPPDAAALRAHGVRLRDAASMGLPGAWRLSAQPPAAQRALADALAPADMEALR